MKRKSEKGNSFTIKYCKGVETWHTFVLNCFRNSKISVRGSTALSSVVPMTETTVITGISLSNFSLRIRSSSRNNKKLNKMKFNQTINVDFKTWPKKTYITLIYPRLYQSTGVSGADQTT